jgi:hypothetical protein
MYRLDSSFAADGDWWIPEVDLPPFRGQISYDLGQLFFFAQDYAGINATKGERPDSQVRPAIQGVLDSGQKVSLGGCSPLERRSRHVGSGEFRISQKFRVEGAIFGVHVTSRALALTSMRVSYQNLEEWIQGEVFKYEPAPARLAPTISMVQYPPRTFEIPSIDARLELEAIWSLDNFPSWTRAGISVEQWIKIVPSTAQTDSWFRDQFWLVTLLLSVLIGQPTLARAIEGELVGEPGKWRPILTWDPRAHTLPPISWRQVAVPYPVISTDAPDFFDRWFRSMSKIGNSANLFIGAIANENSYPHQYFSALVHALETFHRQKMSGSYLTAEVFSPIRRALDDALPKTLDPEVRIAMASRLAFINEVSLKRRLSELASHLDASLLTVISDDLDAFLRQVVDTRNYFTHWQYNKKKPPFSHEQLPDAAHRLSKFLALLFLNEVGVSKRTAAKVFGLPAVE